ncbi:MAG: class II aldolase/adducin family protein [Deinococcota bacterium]
MTQQPQLVNDLLWLARELGHEPRQFALLGEGNVSARASDDTFWVKASGTSMATLQKGDVSLVSLPKVLGLLEHTYLSDDAIDIALINDVLVDTTHKKPSVETFLHALCLNAGATWVGHTHTLSVNQIICSQLGAEPFLGHIFPDAIVVCGAKPAVIPYVDPGFVLAKAVQAELARFYEAEGNLPKVILMENHGPVALGQSSQEVLNIMLMLDKWAKTLLGTYQIQGPRFLTQDDTNRIDNRNDEAYRRKQLVQNPTKISSTKVS